MKDPSPALLAKRERINELIGILAKKKTVSIMGLRRWYYDHKRIMPSLLNKYLKELEDLGKIEFDKKKGIVKYIK